MTITKDSATWAEASPWELAKLLGIGYCGDSNPVDHDGWFYGVHDWPDHGYASIVEFTRDGSTLWVECRTVNHPGDKETAEAFASHDVDPFDLSDSERVFAEIECVRGHWGSEPVEDYSGRLAQRFRRYETDDDEREWMDDEGNRLDEDGIWNAVAGWIKGLAN